MEVMRVMDKADFRTAVTTQQRELAACFTFLEEVLELLGSEDEEIHRRVRGQPWEACYHPEPGRARAEVVLIVGKDIQPLILQLLHKYVALGVAFGVSAKVFEVLAADPQAFRTWLKDLEAKTYGQASG